MGGLLKLVSVIYLHHTDAVLSAKLKQTCLYSNGKKVKVFVLLLYKQYTVIFKKSLLFQEPYPAPIIDVQLS